MSTSPQDDKSKNERLVQKQDELMLELSAAVSALSSLDQVLRDIVSLTSPGSPESIADKQQKLLDELRRWKELQ